MKNQNQNLLNVPNFIREKDDSSRSRSNSASVSRGT